MTNKNKVNITANEAESLEMQPLSQPHPSFFSFGHSSTAGHGHMDQSNLSTSEAPLIETELNSPVSVHAELAFEHK